MAIYMQYGTVQGEVTEANHAKWIELSTFQWGIGRSIDTPIGRATNREAAVPSIAEIVITKPLDNASIGLLNAVLNDSKGTTVKIDFTKTGTGATPDVYLNYELTNTLISGYTISSGGEKPSESITLNFTKLAEKFIPYDDTNKAQPPVIRGYDLTGAKSF
jgi:type VI secretion system secreted protein Hcp